MSSAKQNGLSQAFRGLAIFRDTGNETYWPQFASVFDANLDQHIPTTPRLPPKKRAGTWGTGLGGFLGTAPHCIRPLHRKPDHPVRTVVPRRVCRYLRHPRGLLLPRWMLW